MTADGRGRARLRSRRQRQRFERILLASEGRQISGAAISRAIELAAPGALRARVHGCARARRGVRTPQPRPAADEGRVGRAARTSSPRRSGGSSARASRPTATCSALATPRRRSFEEATAHDCEAIVMAADPDRNRVVGNVLWTQEPQRVRRRAKTPGVPGRRGRLIRRHGRPCRRASLIASSSDSRSSSSSASPVSSSIRPSRWRSVLGWMNSARALSITLRRSAR